MMPQTLIDSLLEDVRRRFYAQASERTFYAHRRRIMHALTWPAAWLRRHGFRDEVTAEAYRRLIVAVLAKIQQHGAPPLPADPNGFFPSYLLKCIQDHCRCDAENVLARFKVIRDRFDFSALTAAIAQKSGVRPQPIVDVLAEAHTILSKPRKRAPGDRSQLSFL